MTAEEVTLLLTLQDRASAGVTAFEAKVGKLGMAGAVASTGLAGIGRAAETLAAKASAGVDRLVSKVINLAKWAAVAGAGFAAWEIKGGVLLNAQVEGFTISLERLTGSALRAREMTRGALAAAGRSPFALADILEATQALTAMGADAGRWLRPLQDVALGTRQSLGEIIQAFRGFYLGGEGGRALARMGFSAAAEGFTGKPEDKARELDRLAAMIESRFGGMTDRVAGTFSGMLQQLKNRWSGLLMAATGPLFTRISSDLRRLLDWAGGGFERLEARISGPLARAWDIASAAAQRFFQTVEAQGWGKALEGLWRSMRPWVLKAATALARLFWEAFKAVLASAGRGEPAGIAALAYGAGKLGAGALINKGVASGWDKIFGAAGRAGTTAAGVGAGVVGGRAIGNLIWAQQAMGGAAAGPPTEYLLGAGAAGAAQGGGWLAALGGIGGLAATVAAVVAAGGVVTAIVSQLRTGKWWTYFEDAGGGVGRWWARDKGAEEAEKKAMDLGEALRAARAEYDAMRASVTGVLDGLRREADYVAGLAEEMRGLYEGFASGLREKFQAARLAGAGSEEKIAAWDKDLMRLEMEFSKLDALRGKSADEIAETYRRQLELLTKQADVQLKIADEMDRLREKALGKTLELLLMGPLESRKFMKEEEQLKALTPPQLEALTATKYGREIIGRHRPEDIFPEEKVIEWGRVRGVPEAPKSGAAAGAEYERTGVAAAAKAEAAGQAALAGVAMTIKAEIGLIEVALKVENKDALVESIKSVVDDLENALRKEVRDGLNEAIGRLKEETSRAAVE